MMLRLAASSGRMMFLLVSTAWTAISLGVASGGAPRVFNVCDHGAKADGTTDDSAAIKETVEIALRAGPGNTVLLPAGNYYLAAGWNQDALFSFSTAGIYERL